ncbi:MAG: hypothetical protein NVS1B13_15530 [Flavisolibacter sp.]
MYTIKNEDELIQKLKNQDKNALIGIYDLYSGAIYGFLLKSIKNEAKAGEVLNKIFLNLFREIKNYDPKKERFFTWLLHLTQSQVRVLVTLHSPNKDYTHPQIFINPVRSSDHPLYAS